MTDLYVKRLPQTDRRLGRHIVHDPRARGFAVTRTMDKSTWQSKRIRIYDPVPNPRQSHGNCTGCDSAMGLNSAGNRRHGVILNMDDADRIYSLATTLDPWDGAWPPTDTGSSGGAAAKAAQRLGLGGEYRHHFGGADDVIQTLMTGRTVGCGTRWMSGMFEPNSKHVIEPTGSLAGGHQYRARGYDLDRDLVMIRCWWGADFRDVWIKREHLNDLLMDNGDAYEQDRA